MKNRLLQYYIQSLSPVHVGSGARWRNGLDYFSAGGRTWLIDRQQFEIALKDNQQALDEFAGGDELNIHALASRHQLDLAKIVATSYRGEATAQDMFEFVRNGTGAPYLPGSSIKGSLRTALLWKLSQTPAWQQDYPELLETVLQARDERWAAAPMVENAFNLATRRKRPNDANRDLMRVLHVSDCHFTAEDLELADTRIFNLLSEERYGWKNISRRRNEKEPREATQLAAEALRLGVAAAVTLTIDDFLLQSPAAQQEAAFGQYAEHFQTQALPKICNDYAARQIAKQRAFFAKYDLKPLVKFYDELEAIRAGLLPSDFLLRLSWGSGWQGMTGELIENPDDMLRVRKKFGMGKMEMVGEMPEQCPICGSKKIRPDNRKEDTGFCYEGMHTFPAPGVKKALFPIFPKTRKIALEAGQPRYPFGWVRFCAAPPDIPPAEDRRQFAPPAFKTSAKIEDRISHAPIATPPKIVAPPPTKPAPNIRPGEKIRAELLKIDAGQYFVRLLEKDTGRELSFAGAYLPIKTGDTVEVRVKSTNPAGDQITKIEFVSKIKK